MGIGVAIVVFFFVVADFILHMNEFDVALAS